MKRVLAIALVFLMVLPLTLVSQALAAPPVWLDLSDVIEDNGFAQPGKTYYIPIMYGGYNLDKEEMERYTYKVSLVIVDDGTEAQKDRGTKKGGSVSLTTIGQYRYVKFSSTASSANQGNVTYEIKLDCYDKLNKEDTEPELLEITVGYGSEDFCNDSRHTMDNDMPLVVFGDDVSDCLITFPDGSVFAVSLVENSKKNKDDGNMRKINFFSSTTPNQTISNRYPNYEIDYLNFSTSATFKDTSILRIYAPGMTYLYSVNGQNELTRLNFSRNGDFMIVPSVRTLSNYVMSKQELSASAASSTPTTVTPPAAGSALTAALAGSAADTAFAAGQTSVRFTGVDNVPLDAMQTISSKAKARGIGSVVNLDTMNASGGVETRVYLNPASATKAFSASARIDDAAVSSVRSTFGSWFKNKVAVVLLSQSGEYGMKVSVATKVSLAGMDTSRLVFYSYNATANSYNQIASPAYWIDGAGYLHFSTTMGNFIVISEGALVKK